MHLKGEFWLARLAAQSQHPEHLRGCSEPILALKPAGLGFESLPKCTFLLFNLSILMFQE